MVLDDPSARPAQARTDAPWQHDKKKSELNSIGKPIRKVDARSKVSGLTKYADDLTLPRMLHMKLLRSTVAHADIVSIDTTKAAALAGVKGILTGKDMPIPFGILPVSQDEHALCPDLVRFVGDPVVAIAATEEEIGNLEAPEEEDLEESPVKQFKKSSGQGPGSEAGGGEDRSPDDPIIGYKPGKQISLGLD